MQVGVIYPQTEIPTDPGTVRAYIRGVEELGYQHIAIYDHVLGADPAVHAGWNGPYDVDTTFHEPLVFYGFLAALTKVELVTAIVVAPQRQTALLAKQAAEVDLLSEGRFRLGIAIGWNPVEYEGLGRASRPEASASRSRSGYCGDCGRSALSLTRASSTASQALGWLPCRPSGRSQSGSVERPQRRTGESASWLTAGSPAPSPVLSSTRPARSSPRRLRTPAATRQPSAWSPASDGAPAGPMS